MVWARRAGWMLTLLSGLVVAGGAPFWQPQCQADEPPGTTVAQGRLQGRFTAADTGKPVAGAKVLLLIDGMPGGKSKSAEALSGPDGRYSLDVPLGHLQIWRVQGPAGFYTQDPKASGVMVTTAAEPHAVQDFVLQPGAAWRLEVNGATIPADKPPLFSAMPNPEQQWHAAGEIIYVASDARGRGVLTIPATAGRYRFSCDLMVSSYSYEIPAAILETDKDFDPRKIKGVPEPHPERRGAVRLRDAAGRSAVVDGVDVLVDAGQAVLRFTAKRVPTEEALVLRGAVVDQAGKPVMAAKCTVAVHFTNPMPRPGGPIGGAFMTQLEAMTDAQGKFELRDVLLPQSVFQPESRVQMLAVKAGFNGAESEKLSPLDFKQAGSGDFGTLVLTPGRTLRGKVVDEKGRPVHGALVSNLTGSFLYSHLACRTDDKGQFAMPDLRSGPQKIWAAYGVRYGQADPDSEAPSEECIITVRPSPMRGKPAPPPAR